MSKRDEVREEIAHVQRNLAKRRRRVRRGRRRLAVVEEALNECKRDRKRLARIRDEIKAGERLSRLSDERRRERLGELQEMIAALREEAKRLRARRRVVRSHVARAVQLVKRSRRRLRNLRRRLRNLARPVVISAAQQGIVPSPVFGGLGTITYVTGHHTAGPIDRSREDAIRLNRAYHDAHAANGWGGIGYHYNLARDGTILCLRPIAQKGAHVGGHNTGNVGITCHGTVGDRPTLAQKRALRWLLANAHTSKMPAPHRSPVPLSGKPRRGHNDWPGHTSNACPGTHKTLYLSGGAKR